MNPDMRYRYCAGMLASQHDAAMKEAFFRKYLSIPPQTMRECEQFMELAFDILCKDDETLEKVARIILESWGPSSKSFSINLWKLVNKRRDHLFRLTLHLIDNHSNYGIDADYGFVSDIARFPSSWNDICLEERLSLGLILIYKYMMTDPDELSTWLSSFSNLVVDWVYDANRNQITEIKLTKIFTRLSEFLPDFCEITVRRVFEKLAGDSAARTSGLGTILGALPHDRIKEMCGFVSALSIDQPDDIICNVFAKLCYCHFNSIIASWIITLLDQLERGCRFQLLYEIVTYCVEQVAAKLASDVEVSATIDILEKMMGICSYSVHEFRLISHQIHSFLLHNTGGCIESTKRVLDLYSTVKQLHPGYPEIYLPLDVAVPSDYQYTPKDLSLSASGISSLMDTELMPVNTKSGDMPPGLLNLGNTCYMNSFLQCLFCSSLVTQSMMANAISKQYKTLHEFQKLAVLSRCTQRSFLQPKSFRSVSLSLPPYQQSMQRP
eukprot:TRINITY_DN1715_c0_g2_i7.p1 TRINITY_DN1715_c0_g2~~TRINITY_DN1715_c0_g2_i7.p1  ORF type:complete len:495 (+),score=82.13 TRINITY_DN1715_c0_g2_i7:24-1508(+)